MLTTLHSTYRWTTECPAGVDEFEGPRLPPFQPRRLYVRLVAAANVFCRLPQKSLYK
jgi:hypothetical protein